MANHGDMCLNYDLINKSDAQIFTICGHTTRLPEIWLIGPSENRLESNLTDSPDFFSSEIRDYRQNRRFLCSHLPIFEKSAQKSRPTRKKSGSGTMALMCLMKIFLSG